MDPKLKERWKYEDPDPMDRGLLLSNRIHKFCEQGLLISKDYKESNLRPASYTLRIGDEYIDSDGVEQHLSEQEESIVFRKNSIIFVSTKEELELPYYIVARFNLRVNWVYDGILLGTGPQVDPGFEGYLSCPLYNLTDTDIIIKRGEPFATIDFEKTTELLAGQSPEEKKKEIGDAHDKQLKVVRQETYSFYKRSPLPALGWRKSHKIVSSLTEMEEEVRTWRNLGIGSVIAFIGLTLSLLAFGANLYRQNSDLNRQLMDDAKVLNQVNAKITQLEQVTDQLSSIVKQNKPPLDVVDSGKGKKPAH
jgi:deoxycytidine triphosphate deaminase/cell division protein FtsB